MKIGFACKYVHLDRTLPEKEIRLIEAAHNCTTTTATWMNRNPELQEETIWRIVTHNLMALRNMIGYVGSLPKPLRMFRITSELLPFYTHKDLKHLYNDKTLRRWMRIRFSHIGRLARHHNIKLSFHPGQFCVLSSDKPHIIQNSIEEFEYHAKVAQWMGYGKSKLDFKCNIHLSGRGGASAFRKSFAQLSDVAKNIITLENDEFSSCLDDVLELRDLAGIVLDVHHYWISKGVYIKHRDRRLKQILESWQGGRPTMHYSYSRDEYLPGTPRGLLDLNKLVESGVPKSKLRAHSDMYPNPDANRYALDFLDRFDLMCEAKTKNWAATQLYQQAVAEERL